MNTGNFTGNKNIKLFYRTWEIENPSETMVIIHGFGEHGGRFDEFAQYLNANNFSCMSMDLYGHGRSEGRRGHVDRFTDYIDDLNIFIEKIVRKKVIILGHSLGGLIAAHYTIKFPETVKAAILSSPAFKLKMKVPFWKRILGEMVSNIYPTLTLANEINPEHLSHDKSKVDAYINDPLVHRIASSRFFTEMTSYMEKAINNAGYFPHPVLILQGGDDPIIDTMGARDFFGKLEMEDCLLKIYPGMYHEILNEIKRQEVYLDILHWVNSHI